MREVRDTNVCRVCAVSLDERRAVVFAAIDNLWKGAAGQAIQNLNLMLGGEGSVRRSEAKPSRAAVAAPAVSSFASRWVEPPPGVEELDPATLAPGFRAGAVACGLKGGGETDLALLACDAPAVDSALLLTRNAAAAAPVRVCRDHCDAGAIRAAVVNSGNANAATGERGIRDALAMRDAAARAVDAEPSAVAVAETGVIGVPLAIDDVLGGIEELAAGLSAAGGRRVRRGDHDHRPRPEGMHGARGRRDGLGPGQGRRDDAAGLRHHALLRADRRRARRPRR